MKQYIVFYTENNKEKSLPVTANNIFDAKYKAFKEQNVPLEAITRIL